MPHLPSPSFHPIFPPSDYPSLGFAHRTSRLPLLIFVTPYPILAHPASRQTNPEPNLESGANIDCCKLYRDNKQVSNIPAPPTFNRWQVPRGSSDSPPPNPHIKYTLSSSLNLYTILFPFTWRLFLTIMMSEH